MTSKSWKAAHENDRRLEKRGTDRVCITCKTGFSWCYAAGLTGNPSALRRKMVAGPEVVRMIQEFNDYAHTGNKKGNRWTWPPWTISRGASKGVGRKLSRGGNVNILLILFRLLTMQCKCTFTKRFTVSTRLHRKANAPCYDNSHKNALRWQP